MPKVDIENCLANLIGFDSGNVRAFPGQINIPHPGDIGILPRDWEDRYRADCVRPGTRVVYTVMHYQTPIAWVLLDEHGLPVEVVIPNVSYSRTTAKYQTYCRNWLPYPNHRVTEL